MGVRLECCETRYKYELHSTPFFYTAWTNKNSLALNCEEDHLNPAGRPLRSDKSGFVCFLLFSCFFVYHSMQIGSQLTEVKRYGHTIFFAYFASHSDLDAQADKQTDSVECSDT